MTDDLRQRNRERLNQAEGDRLSRQSAKSDRDSQLPLPSQSAGYRDGRYWQQRPGHKPVPVTAVDTNGGIEIGQTVTMRGNRMDAMPRVKVEPRAIPQPRNLLLIKYLYQLGQTFYVGGWQPEAVAVYTLQTGETFASASLDNLGGDLWRVDLVTTIDGTHYLKSFTNAAEIPTPELSSTLSVRPGELYGFGFGYLAYDNTFTPTPEGSITGITQHYTVKGEIHVASGAETRTAVTEAVYFGDQPWYSVTRNRLATAVSPIPLTPELSYGYTLTNTSNNYSPSGGSGVPSVPEDSDTLTADFLSTVRIDRTGRFAIGRYVTTTDVDQQTSGLLWIADSSISRVQTSFVLDDHYLDVTTAGFTAIPKTAFDPYRDGDTTQISIQFATYSPGFNKQGDLETRVYPPQPNDPDNFTFYTASYHE